MATLAPYITPDRSAPAPADLRERAFAGFTVVWALATLFHQAGWPGRHVGLPMYVLTLAAIFMLLRPGSLRVFLGLAALQVGMVVYQLPHDASNHWVFMGFVAVTILLTWLGMVVQRRSTDLTGGELFTTFAPAGRWLLVILYFYAVLHKLNTDFLTPGISCATDLMSRIAHTLPGLPMGTWSDQLAIYGTLAVEAAIPILLVVRRTRLYGALLGCAFHLMLIFDPRWVFYDFSSVVYAMYFLFVADIALTAVHRAEQEGGAAARWIARLKSPRTLALLRNALICTAVVVATGFVYEVATGHGPGDHPRALWLMRHLPRLPFLLYGIIALSTLGLAWLQYRRTAAPDSLFTLRPRTLGAVMIPVVFLNGLAPYIGLKTENAFSMFSNLATEGGRTNHLFMPVRFRVAGYQEDLVEVVESSQRYMQRLANRNELLPFFQFRYMAGRAPGHSVTYIRNGVRHEVPVIADSPELMARAPVMQKVIQFRKVRNIDGPRPCSH